MARFKDFDAAEAERTNDPITFVLGGREWVAEHVNSATFLTLARKGATGGDEALLAFYEFIVGTLPEGDREDFFAMLDEKDIQMTTLKDLGQWIVEQATGNPTTAASPSLPSQSKTGKPRVVYSRSSPQESTGETAASVTG
jgi:hypothetical protein